MSRPGRQSRRTPAAAWVHRWHWIAVALCICSPFCRGAVLRGLAVGVNDYASFASLSGAGNDVRYCAEVLADLPGIETSTMTCMTDVDDGTDRFPTRAHILARLGRLASSSGEQDVTLVVVSMRCGMADGRLVTYPADARASDSSTAIPVRSFVEAVTALPRERCALLLDLWVEGNAGGYASTLSEVCAGVAHAMCVRILPASSVPAARGLGLRDLLSEGFEGGADLCAGAETDGVVRLGELVSFVALRTQSETNAGVFPALVRATGGTGGWGGAVRNRPDTVLSALVLPDVVSSLPEQEVPAPGYRAWRELRDHAARLLAEGRYRAFLNRSEDLVAAYRFFVEQVGLWQAAKQLRADVQDARRTADANQAGVCGAEDYAAAFALEQTGNMHWEQQGFAQAAQKWKEAATRFRRAALGCLRQQIGETLDALSADDWVIYGGDAWQTVEGLRGTAGRAEGEGDLAGAVNALNRIVQFLPDIRTASLTALLQAARTSAVPATYKTALTYLEKARRLAPRHPEVNDLLDRVRANFRFSAGDLIENSLGMTFAYIPPGSFVMGSPEDEPGRDPDERPHKVTLGRGFFMGTTEVTVGQWQTVMGGNARWKPGRRQSGAGGVSSLPVHSVSWEEAQRFCRHLSRMDQKRYRLPTEAEWEYACRAGTTGPFNTGDADSLKGRALVYSDAAPVDQAAPVATVGDPNAWGLYDMHGNVWEWCTDWYAPYPEGPVEDPAGPEERPASLDQARRIVRGGSWFDEALMARSGNRWEYSPAAGADTIGLRVLLEAADVSESDAVRAAAPH